MIFFCLWVRRLLELKVKGTWPHMKKTMCGRSPKFTPATCGETSASSSTAERRPIAE